jgi:hypothetical protein
VSATAIRGTQKRRTDWREAAFVALALVLMFALEVSSARVKSPTYDEPFYLTRGYAFVKMGDRHILTGAPLPLTAWNGLPLLLLPDLNLETDHPTWEGSDFHDVSEHFLWESGNDVDALMLLARLPTMVLSLLLAAAAHRWARELYGRRAGWLALFLAVLSPNLLAHARLASVDLGMTAFFFLACYRFWRYLEAPTRSNLLWAGVALGLSQGTKFSALLIFPIWAAVGAGHLFLKRAEGGESLPRRAASLALAGAGMALIGFLTLWATYGFELAPLAEGGIPVPAATHFREWGHISDRLAGVEGRRAPAFLAGRYSDTGWPGYFPVAFGLKTPLPVLILLLWAAILSLRRWRRELALILPPLLFFAFSLFSKLNLGYRYILPVLPFAQVYAGKIAAGSWPFARARWGRALVAVLAGWYAFGSLCIAPHYLATFNELAGGPDGGWRYLVDSNLDWGQDAILLARYLEERGVDRVKLAWFGESRPAYYGVSYDPLPAWPPSAEEMAARTFSPVAPAPGLYAISATNLQGVLLDDHDTYAWFRRREPAHKVGYSVFIYEVPPWGERPVNVALSGLGADQLDRDAFEALGTNDLALRWFDARHSLILPAGDGGWAAAEGTLPDPGLASRFGAPAESGDARLGRDGALRYRLFRLPGAEEWRAPPGDSPVWWSPATAFPAGGFERYEMALPVNVGGQIALLGYDTSAEARPGGQLTLLTAWRVLSESHRPLKLFVHLLDETGQVADGQDRLDVPTAGWHVGDVFVQVHRLPVPENGKSETYQLEIGWYDGETLRRLPVLDGEGAAVADRLLLTELRTGD